MEDSSPYAPALNLRCVRLLHKVEGAREVYQLQEN
jgi:hypothetical protein